MQRTDKCVRPSAAYSCSIYKSLRRILTGKPWLSVGRQRAYVRTVYSVLWGNGPYCLSSVSHVWKIRDRKQRTDIGKYSFVNRTVKNWNQLPVEALGAFPCKPKIFRNRFREAITNGVK